MCARSRESVYDLDQRAESVFDGPVDDSDVARERLPPVRNIGFLGQDDGDEADQDEGDASPCGQQECQRRSGQRLKAMGGFPVPQPFPGVGEVEVERDGQRRQAQDSPVPPGQEPHLVEAGALVPLLAKMPRVAVAWHHHGPVRVVAQNDTSGDGDRRYDQEPDRFEQEPDRRRPDDGAEDAPGQGAETARAQPFLLLEEVAELVEPV